MIAGPELTFSRAHILEDEALPPVVLKGPLRAVFLALYCAIVVGSFSGTLYLAVVAPLGALVFFLFMWAVNNIAFTLQHLVFHAGFIELPEGDMDAFMHSSLIHHYRHITIYHEYWLESRMGYFVDPRNPLTGRTSVAIFAGHLIGAAALSLLSPLAGLAFVSMGFLWWLAQGTVHEWYHVPKRLRKSYYNRPLYLLYSFLERVGFFSTKHHITHHKHQLKNLEEVVNWLDMALPLWDAVPAYLWRKALPLYQPGKREMSRFLDKVLYGGVVLLYMGMIATSLLCFPPG